MAGFVDSGGFYSCAESESHPVETAESVPNCDQLICIDVHRSRISLPVYQMCGSIL